MSGQPDAVSTEAGPVVLAGHIRIERHGPHKTFVYIDDQLFPWCTSVAVSKVITAETGGMVAVTLAIVAGSAEMVDAPMALADQLEAADDGAS